MPIPSVRTKDFFYELPADRIAQNPLEKRHDSKLLTVDFSSQKIEDRKFVELPEILPAGSLLVVNDSKVMPARIPMIKATGGAAEVFLLDPIEPEKNPTLALQRGSPAIWNVLIGGKRISAGDLLKCTQLPLEAHVLEREQKSAKVRLEWSPSSAPLSEVLEHVGKLPLPPYMKREASSEDLSRYQTVYARAAGSVAAPTAGLHFSEEVNARLAARDIQRAQITLHVGAGTFRPVEAEQAAEHDMHEERLEVSLDFLDRVSAQLANGASHRPLIAVGTTSLRTLESLYWLGVRLRLGVAPTHLDQWSAYELLEHGENRRLTASESFASLARHLRQQGAGSLVATTRLMIVPGYQFQTADMLLTNFHQPGSSLILLVAAWAGDNWRAIYEHALRNSYRFLSYGDSSLLRRKMSYPS